MKLGVVIARGENVAQFEIRHVSQLVIITTKVPNRLAYSHYLSFSLQKKNTFVDSIFIIYFILYFNTLLFNFASLAKQ